MRKKSTMVKYDNLEDAAMSAIRDARPYLVYKTAASTEEEHKCGAEAFAKANPWNWMISIHLVYV